MGRYFLNVFSTLLLSFFLSLAGISQFSFTPKRTNIKINHSDSLGWEITNITGTKTLATFQTEYAYIQIINNQIRVYQLSEQLWNSHPNSTFLDKINISHHSFSIETDSTRFDSFSSFSISSKGGHIRIFKYPETMQVPLRNGGFATKPNRNTSNHIFINGNKKAKISSRNTLFMISPKGDVFEIDHSLNIWRFILSNRTLTPWTSDPPNEKMIFHIFKPEDFKTIIPLGKKNNKFVFQVIDHKNKMGIATLSLDYFEIEYEVPPIYEFITPSMHNDFYLVYDNNRLGALYFQETENDDEIPLFKTLFTHAKKSLITSTEPNTNRLIADGAPISDPELIEGEFSSTSLLGIEKITDDLILYTDYSTELNIASSGLYCVSQQKWYIKPNASLLKSYPTTLLELKDSGNSIASYSVYSTNGFKLAENVSETDRQTFFYVSSLLLEMEIDTLALLPEYDSFTYKFRSNLKWGVLRINKEKFEILLPPQYLRIHAMGTKKSLVLEKENSFDWYGIDYSKPNSTNPQLIKNKNPLVLSLNNTQSTNVNNISLNAQKINGLVIYNYQKNEQKKGLVYISDRDQPDLTGNKVMRLDHLIHIETNTENDSTQTNHALYNYNLKKIKINYFDSANTHNDFTICYDTHKPLSLTTQGGLEINTYQVSAGWYHDKAIKTFKNYSRIYFYEDLFIAKDGTQWKVIDPTHNRSIKQTFVSEKDAFDLINSLK